MSTPIRFKGLVKTTAEIESDKFAGRIGFNSTLARYVVYYNATQYATLARNDVLETFSQGVQDSTLTDGQIVQAGGSGRLRSDSGLTSAQSGGATVSVTVGSGSSDANVGFIANGKSGYSKSFVCRTNGSTRWSFGCDNSVESGTNTGSKFFLTARDDAGGIIDDVISVVRASAGLMTFGGTTSRPANFTGAIQAGGIQRISAGGALSVVSMASTNLAGTGSRVLVTDASGNVSADGAAPKIRSYAQMYRTAAGAAQAIANGSTYIKITPFDTNDADYTDSTPDHTNDQITIGRTGRYAVAFTRSYSVSAANVTWHVGVLKNGAIVPASVQEVKTTATGTPVYANLCTQITCAAGDVITIGVYHDNGASVNITYEHATLSVNAID